MDVGNNPQGDVVDGQFIVASAQRPALLEPTHHPLDDVPLPVRLLIEVRVRRLVLASRDDRADVALPQPVSYTRVAVTLVAASRLGPARATRLAGTTGTNHDRFEGPRIVFLTGTDLDGQKRARRVADQMNLGAESAP